MALKIVKKKNQTKEVNKKIGVITILGTLNNEKAFYTKEATLELEIKSGKYKNMLPLLYNSFKDIQEASLIAIYTKEALEIQKNVLPEIALEENGFLIDEKEFNQIFSTINAILSDISYTDFIVDISHGFRHLPILSTISMVINNFQDSSRIKNILFAKEINKFEKYEVIDLKPYLEIANISFVLTTFDDNYTVAHHINSLKYKSLIDALNDFSNDIMALNLSNLNDKTLINLINELDKIDDVSIASMAQQLKKNLLEDFSLETKRYLTFYKFSKNLFEKNYILLSLSLLYESIRMYLKTQIKKDYPTIMAKIEKYYDNDIYKLGDFCKNLGKQDYYNLKKGLQDIISESEYNKLQEIYPIKMPTPSLMKDIMNTRNDLSHANSKMKFAEIKQKTETLIERYNSQYKLDLLLK